MLQGVAGIEAEREDAARLPGFLVLGARPSPVQDALIRPINTKALTGLAAQALRNVSPPTTRSVFHRRRSVSFAS